MPAGQHFAPGTEQNLPASGCVLYHRTPALRRHLLVSSSSRGRTGTRRGYRTGATSSASASGTSPATWRKGDRQVTIRNGSVSDGVKRWDIRYRAHNRRVRPAVVLVPARFGPAPPDPGAAARDLAAWPQRACRRSTPASGATCRRGGLRACLPWWPGAAVAACLVGLAGADRRSRAHAGNRPRRAAVASRGPAEDLRGRGEHGRPGDAAAARPVPEAPSRCGRVRLSDQLLPQVLRFCAQPRRPTCAGAGAGGGRGHTAHQSARIRPPQSHALATRSRSLRVCRSRFGGATRTRS